MTQVLSRMNKVRNHSNINARQGNAKLKLFLGKKCVIRKRENLLLPVSLSPFL